MRHASLLKIPSSGLRQRDEIDANRVIAPLRPADDAIVLTSDGKQAEEVLAEAIGMVEARLAELEKEANSQ